MPQPPSKEKVDLINKAAQEFGFRKYSPEFRNLLLRYAHVISENKYDIGFTDSVTHKIILTNPDPAYRKQFPLPAEHMKIIENDVKMWLKLGIIEPANSRYNSPIFCVVKKDGQGLRAVLDYRGLNDRSMPDRYSIRGVEECIAEVGKAKSKVFSSLDLTAGFWQMKLDEESRPYTAFTIPQLKQQFQWCTSPMGLTGCPASFSRLMDKVMQGLDNVLTYIDDVLVHSANVPAHLRHLEEAFDRLGHHGLKLNLPKCTFAAEEVPYLGHVLTKYGVRPGADKSKAIREALVPATPRASAPSWAWPTTSATTSPTSPERPPPSSR